MMDEHPWRAFCRHDSFREWRACLLSSKLRRELNSFLFPPLLRSSSSPLNSAARRNKRHVKSHLTCGRWAFYRLRKLSSKAKTLSRFRVYNKRKINRLWFEMGRKIIGGLEIQGVRIIRFVCLRFYYFISRPIISARDILFRIFSIFLTVLIIAEGKKWQIYMQK